MINDRTIQLVRQRTDLVSLIGETVKLVRRGRSWKGLCPFHKERSPSFHVTPERGMFHCFGCGEHGNAITFVMKVEALTFPEAVRRLAEKCGVEVEDNATEQERKEEAAKRKSREDLYAAMNVAAVYYEKMLVEHPSRIVAENELASRGLVASSPTDLIATTLQAFRIGYAPAGWDGLATYLRAQGISPAMAETVGLLKRREGSSGHYDAFRNRLMFAVVDLQGRVVAFSGRILPDPKTGLVDKDTGKYINSPETPIYKKGETVFGLFQARQAIRSRDEVVVVEGNFDVVSLHARGIGHVVAPLGTAFTPEQAMLLKRFAPSATMLFDGDAAGRKATFAAREPCKRAGLRARAAVLPSGKDPDDFVRSRGPEALESALKAARGLLEHLITQSLDEGFERADSEEKVARVREVVELLASEEDPTVRAMGQKYADEIAARLPTIRDDRTGMADAASFGVLRRAVETALRKPMPNDSSDAPAAPVPWRRSRSTFRASALEESFLGCLLDFPSLLAESEIAPVLSYLDGDAVFVVAALRETGHDEGDFGLDADEFLAKVPRSFHAFARNRLALPVHQDIATARRELLANAEKLKVRSLSSDNAEDAAEAARAEAMGDDESALSLLREVRERTRKKHQLV
jgi:DNA primase